MRDERGKRKHVIPPSLIRRGMESLHSIYSVASLSSLVTTEVSLALKHSFQPPFAAKRVAPKPLGESLTGAEQ